MGFQYTENLLRRYRGQRVTIKSRSGSIYEGAVAEVTNDYVALNIRKTEEDTSEQVFVLLHSIEAVLPASES
jgi:small nuclear ribonucleoprotein (snRNP)-like protein